MSLAGYQHDVARTGVADRTHDCLAPVDVTHVRMRADPALLSLAEYCGFVSVHALETQLRGFGLTAEWIKQEKSKKGGERRSFRKQTNDEWRAQLDAWFDRNVCAMPARRHSLNKQKFVRLVEALVERAVAHA